jgi:hypothetical protein
MAKPLNRDRANGMPCINMAHVPPPHDFPTKIRILSVGYAGKMACRRQCSRTYSGSFLCRIFLFSYYQNVEWRWGDRAMLCMPLSMLQYSIPVLMEGRRRLNGEKVLVIDTAVAQNLQVDNTIHPTPLSRKDLQHLDGATRWGN